MEFLVRRRRRRRTRGYTKHYTFSRFQILFSTYLHLTRLLSGTVMFKSFSSFVVAHDLLPRCRPIPGGLLGVQQELQLIPQLLLREEATSDLEQRKSSM